ncbi:MAG: putative movement protein [Corpardiv virus 2]|nr:MAG: putative movement protein [Corpardiv virus 2]
MSGHFDPWYRRTLSLLNALEQYPGTPIMNPNPNQKVVKIPITRSNYSSLSKISHLNRNMYTITGPTGCGKSTFALLHLIPGRRALIICPSKANAANLLTEFNQRIPDTIRKLRLKMFSPKATLVNYVSNWYFTTPLLLMTAEDFVSFVAKHRAFPPVDMLIQDEYHLQSRASTETRMILFNVRSTFPGNNPTIIFVSATPPDEPVPPPRTSGITKVECKIPDIMTRPIPDIYRRTKHHRYSNNYLLIVADSCESAHRLTTDLQDLSEDVFCACACPSPSTVDTFLRTVHSNYTVITTPDTESGMTFPCSHMVNPGTSVTAIFRNRVVIQQSISLSQAQASQRAGRAGRSGHTVLFTAPSPRSAPATTSNPIVTGSAYLLVLALTHSHPRSSEAIAITNTFPRLPNTSPRAAQECLLSNPALIGLYRMDNHGQLYAEFGGSSTTFAQDNAADLTLFKWPTGSAYAPFLNTLAEHDLTKGMTKASIDTITETIATSQMLQLSSLPDALQVAAQEPTTYSPYLWLAFKQLHGPTNLHVAVKPTDPLQDYSNNDRCSLEYMLTPTGLAAWHILTQLGATYQTQTVRYHKGGVGPSGNTLDSDYDYCSRQLCFQNETIEYSSKALLDDTGKVSEAKVTSLLLTNLRPLLITTALTQRPDSCCDLSLMSHLFNRSNNPWLNSLNL